MKNLLIGVFSLIGLLVQVPAYSQEQDRPGQHSEQSSNDDRELLEQRVQQCIDAQPEVLPKVNELLSFQRGVAHPLFNLIRPLIESNNSQAVAKIFQQMDKRHLNRELRKVWETNLEAYQSPLPDQQKILLFRGIGLKNLTGGGVPNYPGPNLDITDPKDDFYLISATFRKSEKEFRSKAAKRNPLLKWAMYRHSLSAKDSPFRSYTLDFEVAKHFSPVVVAFLVDPRVLIYNTKAAYNENEVLIPFTIFPESFVGFLERDDEMEDVKKALIAKYGIPKANQILHNKLNYKRIIKGVRYDKRSFRKLGKERNKKNFQ